MAKGQETTTKFRVDISELKSAMQEARKQVAYANSEFKAVSSSLDDWSKSSEGLEAKLKQLKSNLSSQKSILSAYEKTLEAVRKEYGENSNEAREYATKLNNQQAVVNKLEQELGEYEDALEEVSEAEKKAAKTGKSVAEVLDDVGNEAEDAGDGFTVLKGAVAEFAGNILTSLANSLKDAATNLFNLAEETREYRTELAKMETAAEQAGASADYIKDKWHDMGAVLGDEGAVAEGLNNLLAAGFTTEDAMDKITSHLEGAAIKWKDTLKFEGLADGLQETLATGAAVGSFGEMLERSGINLDTFNEGLAACSTEADKQNYVLAQLSNLGLKEISEAYRSNNKDMIAANLANSEYADTVAEFGEKIEPVSTAVKNGFNGILEKILELVEGVDLEAFIAKIEEGFGVITNTIIPAIKDGLQWILDNKDAVIAGLVGIGAGFAAFNVASMIMSVVDAFKAFKLANEGATVAQWLMNAAMNANPIVLIITLVAALVAGIIAFVATNDEARAKLVELWGAIKNFMGKAIEKMCDFFTVTIPEALATMLERFKALPGNIWTWLLSAIDKVQQWKANLTTKAQEAAKSFIDSVVNAIKELPGKVWTWLQNTVSKVGEWATTLASKGRQAAADLVTAVVNKVQEIPGKLASVGGDIVRGLWNGIDDKSSWLKNKISDWVGDVTSWVKKFFKIGSPSRLMADEVGKWLPAGIAVGIDKNSESVFDSMRGVVSGVVSGAREGAGVGTSGGAGVGGSVVNYYQTINSPKQLNRLDVYRHTKNLLGYAKG